MFWGISLRSASIWPIPPRFEELVGDIRGALEPIVGASRLESYQDLPAKIERGQSGSTLGK